MPTMSALDVLLQQVVNGLALGMMYALLALGFTMVYGIIELINFSHFSVFMTGTFVGLFVVGLLLMLALWHLVRRTTLGKAMRATAQDADAARMMGIDVDRVVVLTFFLGSALAGAGSLFFGLYYGFTSYYIGYTTGLRAFTSAVLGGIGTIPGAVLGGLCIRLTQALGGQLIG